MMVLVRIQPRKETTKTWVQTSASSLTTCVSLSFSLPLTILKSQDPCEDSLKVCRVPCILFVLNKLSFSPFSSILTCLKSSAEVRIKTKECSFHGVISGSGWNRYFWIVAPPCVPDIII